MKDTGAIFQPKFAIVLIVLVTIIFLLPAFGLTFGDPAATMTDQYYIDNSQTETGANNVVAAVVFDFRGFDTLGEATVLFIAVLGVAMIFRRLHK
ncbi:Membrane bound hydrogenase subunit mbhE [Methanocorpusculum labreanum Z]|uniref:Membrane bound hydrogenase subunit mbhE n=1 Tax=Methanocorpusculum labreanum (strain ATCC 43576 / DSM 4855 / Z) TaxID=410358 RepID=A2SS16_METLZ|nr:hydrogen gas-evolving membrane-bound hydrogenase subunit E [Methanocorpusculum labreanum]ABN07122.1 Membrane bound hydrogenase subunit mbhE [Methanocorpusculum labreanum Z]